MWNSFHNFLYCKLKILAQDLFIPTFLQAGAILQAQSTSHAVPQCPPLHDVLSWQYESLAQRIRGAYSFSLCSPLALFRHFVGCDGFGRPVTTKRSRMAFKIELRYEGKGTFKVESAILYSTWRSYTSLSCENKTKYDIEKSVTGDVSTHSEMVCFTILGSLASGCLASISTSLFLYISQTQIPHSPQSYSRG